MAVSVSTSAASCNGGKARQQQRHRWPAPTVIYGSNGVNTSSITGLYPGTYAVTVTDAAG
ncbi:MAG: hypothetical protein IPP29_20770 [Bacteroidetes bacterium]|nr:hypothetical protein [Bacteroidota bacterium]